MLRYEVLFLTPTNLIGIKIFFIILPMDSLTDANIKAVQESRHGGEEQCLEDLSPKHNNF